MAEKVSCEKACGFGELSFKGGSAVNFETDVVDVERGSDMSCVESMLMC